jgi:hypothetical protein
LQNVKKDVTTKSSTLAMSRPEMAFKREQKLQLPAITSTRTSV